MLDSWKANTNPVYARDIKEGGSGQTYQFENVFLPGKEPNGTPFSSIEMNKIIEAINQLSGQNLLINSDFRVHQRGTSITDFHNGGKGRYSADRWMVSCSSAVNSFLSMTCQDEGRLKVSNSRNLEAAFTLKYLMEDCDLFQVRGRTLGILYSINGVTAGKVRQIPADQTSHEVVSLEVTVPAYATITIDYVKAEIVSNEVTNESVLRYLSPYRPKPFAEEYAACIRYYQIAGPYHLTLRNTASGSENFYIYPMSFPRMRTAPESALVLDHTDNVENIYVTIRSPQSLSVVFTPVAIIMSLMFRVYLDAELYS